MPLGTVWSPEEDQRLGELVKLHGPKKWSQIATDLGTAKGSKQCRRRWKNFLSLDERKLGSWTAEEDAQLLDYHRRHGNKWTLIAQEIGGRTDNAVKNRWAALEKKRRGGPDAGSGSGHQPRGGGGSNYTSRGNNTSDLLGVRRVITKDQPQRNLTSRQLAGLQHQQEQQSQQRPMWMTQQQQHAAMGGQAAAAAQQQQQDQGVYNMQAAAAFGRQPGSIPLGKPDLTINIPATAPELPYSQRPQAGGADANRLHKAADALTPVEVWLGSGLHIDQGKGEDDALLSTSRQGAHAAMAGLTTPTEEPNTLQELYRFLYSATPAAQQLAAAAAATHGGGGDGGPSSSGAWRDAVSQQQSMLPASSAPYTTGHQLRQQQPSQPQQQLYQPPPGLAQDAAAAFMQQHGRMMQPPTGLQQNYGQPPLQVHQGAAAHGQLSKLSRTVSYFEGGGHPSQQPAAGAIGSQLSLPEGMMLRQQLPPPQPRFVPQGAPAQGSGTSLAGAPPGLMGMHSSAAVTTAAGGFQPNSLAQQKPPEMPLMHRQMALSQPPPPAPVPHLMPQEPTMLPAQPSMHHLQALMQPAGGCRVGPQPPPSQQWGAEELRQLLDILGEAAVSEGQQQGMQLQQQPPLCSHMMLGHHHSHSDCDKLEHANNVTGSLTAAS